MKYIASKSRINAPLIWDSKHFYNFPLDIEQIIINGEQAEESQEKSNGRQKVPHVMVVKKVTKSEKKMLKKDTHQSSSLSFLLAELVPLPRLWRTEAPWLVLICIESKCNKTNDDRSSKQNETKPTNEIDLALVFKKWIIFLNFLFMYMRMFFFLGALIRPNNPC